MKLKLIAFILVFAKIAFSQEPSARDHISEKVVIGFPGITAVQLNLIKAEFIKYPQITAAKFVFEDHNCMLISFDQNLKQFTVYAELLKTISTVYDINNCYFKTASAYDEIANKYKQGTEFIVK